MILPQSIWTRSLLILLITMVLVEGVALYVFHDKHWRFVNYKLADNLASEVTFFYRELENDPKYLQRYNKKRNNVFDVKIIVDNESNFKKLPKLPVNRQRSRLERSLSNFLQRPSRLAYYGDKHNVAIGVPSQQYEESYYFFIVPAGRVFDNSIQLFLYWLLISGIVLSSLAGYFLYMQVRPIIALSIMADDFGKGRHLDNLTNHKNIPIRGAREVRMVARSFNQMMKRIYYQLKQRTTMLAGVSHDLRTPLTKLRLNLAFIESDTKYKEVIDKMKNNLADMERMIELYLKFAKGEENEKLSSLDIKSFVNEIVASWRPEAKKQKKQLQAFFDLEAGQKILIREHAMRRCLDNIIGNALKNASQVNISIAKKDDIKNNESYIIFNIADNGKGIALEEREKIFEAFYQVKSYDQSIKLHQSKRKSSANKNKKDSSSNEGGYGLGLAIARDIVLAHGGNITVGKDNDLGGAVFSIAIPL